MLAKNLCLIGAYNMNAYAVVFSMQTCLSNDAFAVWG